MKKNQNGITILGISIILIVTLILVGVIIALVWKVNIEKQKNEQIAKEEQISTETAADTVNGNVELALDIRIKIAQHTNSADSKLKVEIGEIVKEIEEIDSLLENNDNAVYKYSDNEINYVIDGKKFRISFEDTDECVNGKINAIYLIKDNQEDLSRNYYAE